MMSLRRLAAAALSLAVLAISGSAHALDLNGAWATSADQCGKVFTHQDGKLAFSENSDVYGGGFIIEGDQIVGKFARCKIKARKNDGAMINLLAACASDIMLSSVQFSLKEVDANTVARMFPGMEEMTITYHRCPAQ
jgi:hypothetical protein